MLHAERDMLRLRLRLRGRPAELSQEHHFPGRQLEAGPVDALGRRPGLQAHTALEYTAWPLLSAPTSCSARSHQFVNLSHSVGSASARLSSWTARLKLTNAVPRAV
jgi:hypothetical protein